MRDQPMEKKKRFGIYLQNYNNNQSRIGEAKLKIEKQNYLPFVGGHCISCVNRTNWFHKESYQEIRETQIEKKKIKSCSS